MRPWLGTIVYVAPSYAQRNVHSRRVTGMGPLLHVKVVNNLSQQPGGQSSSGTSEPAAGLTWRLSTWSLSSLPETN
ncbi:hypothetical protein BDW68DRAFT_149461 [Aspergillus falconensis]